MTLLCLLVEHWSSGSLSFHIGKESWDGEGKGNSASGFRSRRSRQPFLSVQPAGLKGYQLRGAVSNCISWEARPTRRAESNPFYLLPYCLRLEEHGDTIWESFVVTERLSPALQSHPLNHAADSTFGGWNGGSSDQGLRPQEGLKGQVTCCSITQFPSGSISCFSKNTWIKPGQSNLRKGFISIKGVLGIEAEEQPLQISPL